MHVFPAVPYRKGEDSTIPYSVAVLHNDEQRSIILVYYHKMVKQFAQWHIQLRQALKAQLDRWGRKNEG